MSIRKAIIAAVIASPGIHAQEIAAILGITTRNQMKSLSTQLSAMCQAKKLRKDSILAGPISRPRFWPTPTSTTDGRTVYWAEYRARTGKPKDPYRHRRPKRETHKQKRAKYVSANARVPKVKSQLHIVDPPRPRSVAVPSNAQTVEDFVRDGGQIERLARHASSNPLRFVPKPDPPNRQARSHRRKAGAL